MGDGVRQVRRWDEITVTTEDVLMRPSLAPEIRKRAQRGSMVWQVFPYEGSSSGTLKNWEEVNGEEKLKGSKGKR